MHGYNGKKSLHPMTEQEMFNKYNEMYSEMDSLQLEYLKHWW